MDIYQFRLPRQDWALRKYSSGFSGMKKWLVILIGVLEQCAGAKILAIAPMPFRSHCIVIEQVLIELANKGHEVTFYTPCKQPKPVPRLKEIILPDMHEFLMGMVIKPGQNRRERSNSTLRIKQMKRISKFLWPFAGVIAGPPYSEAMLSTPEIQKLLKSDQRYDVIISETFYAESIIAGLSYKFKIPIIAVSAFMANYYANYLVGNPASPAYIPDTGMALPARMNFCERFINTVKTAFAEMIYRLLYLRYQDIVMRKHFGNDLPPLDDIIKNTSLILVNHHFSLAFPRPLLPNVIEIGGNHIRPPKSLPADLQKFLDESKEGVILFSMGSVVKRMDLPKETKQVILKTFSRLKYDVLWKIEEDLPEMPKNVKISKWLPQSDLDLLAHSNIKLFITHGGLLSIMEAVERGVPIIGIPMFGDHPTNMLYATSAGFAITLDFDNLSEDLLYDTIMEVVNNPKYRENARQLSTIVKDRPLSTLETAKYWVEYVIRHKGAPHLKSAAQDLAWYQLYLLDVLGFIFVVLTLMVYIIFRAVKFILEKLFCRKKAPVLKEKKRKIN